MATSDMKMKGSIWNAVTAIMTTLAAAALIRIAAAVTVDSVLNDHESRLREGNL